MLTREGLENDTLRKNREQNFKSLPLVSEQEFNASLERILADWNPRDDVWVFCYGSLIWNPLFHYTERRNVTVHGFHRSFCLRSRHGRGSVEEPGLMLGLDFGGCCNGVALRIPAKQVRHELMLVWRREMAIGSYAPRWITARAGKQKLTSVAFIVNHAHPHYAGKLPLETITKILATAKGKFGSGADYLYQTVDCLAQHGIRDSYLSELREKVMKITHGVHHPIECPEIGA
ncbi:MAG: gamma-glutamylcyclotransferase [Proteobacteria bacterium]|nr:gamma-glutamylcyclotransferase [Pseudomonadota bacterium]